MTNRVHPRFATAARTAGATVVAGVMLLGTAGCSDSAGPPASERYVLASVNGTALPAPYPGWSGLEIVSGALVLHADGSAVESLTVRCAAGLPSTVECTAAAAPQSRTGQHSAEGWIRFDDTTYPAVRDAGRITIEYGPPPSSGIFARATFVYER